MMKDWCILASLIFLAFSNIQARLDFFQYCSYKGYPVQDHTISTNDHYNLKFFRIQAKNTTIISNKPVIYLQHGLVDSSDTWIVNDQHLAPAFYFANNGYDVWVGNSRGNRYSNKKISPSVKDFWNFTFADMATQDLPAAFKYIAKITGRKINYIGHSQGTMIMFIALSLKISDVKDNLLSFNAFGPVAYLTHQKSKGLNLLGKSDVPKILMKSQVKWVFMLNKEGMLGLGQICIGLPFVCAANLKAISQMNNTVNNLKRLPIILSHFPSGTSTKNFNHYQQYVQKQQFKAYDYGTKLNMKIYGNKNPPFYKLNQIDFPVHLYVGKYDKLADVEDAKLLFDQLKNSPKKIYEFGHATFVWGKSIVHLKDAIQVIVEAEKQYARNNILIS